MGCTATWDECGRMSSETCVIQDVLMLVQDVDTIPGGRALHICSIHASLSILSRWKSDLHECSSCSRDSSQAYQPGGPTSSKQGGHTLLWQFPLGSQTPSKSFTASSFAGTLIMPVIQPSSPTYPLEHQINDALDLERYNCGHHA